MHELTIARAIVDMATAEAEHCKAGSVKEIELEVGILSGVDYDALVFALSMAVRGTMLEFSIINVLSVKGLGYCAECGLNFPMFEIWATCPQCAMPASQIIDGEQLRFVSLVVDD
jgi:hydrogenase nickel incorporation protein HypA/HybF